LALNI